MINRVHFCPCVRHVVRVYLIAYTGGKKLFLNRMTKRRVTVIAHPFGSAESEEIRSRSRCRRQRFFVDCIPLTRVAPDSLFVYTLGVNRRGSVRRKGLFRKITRVIFWSRSRRKNSYCFSIDGRLVVFLRCQRNDIVTL